MREVINVAPATNIIDVLGGSGYTFESAIADIIDNSLFAQAMRIDIHFEFNSKTPFLTIHDNGNGMSKSDLKEAAVLANRSVEDKRDSKDLGRFSMGLKSASMSFCNKLTVVSKRLDSSQNNLVMNFEEIKRNNKWDVVINETGYENLNIKKSGTIIIWENLTIFNDSIYDDKTFIYEKLDSLNKYLSHVFGRLINSKGIQISVNGVENLVKSWDPFLTSHPRTNLIHEEQIMFMGSKIKVKGYVLPPYETLDDHEKDYMYGYGLREQQGFYIYRNERLIKEGSWLDISNLKLDSKCDYARIFVSINSNLDKAFRVSFMKNSLEIPLELVKDFTRIANVVRKGSKNSYNFIKHPTIPKKKKTSESEPIWLVTSRKDELSVRVNVKNDLLVNLLKDVKKSDLKRVFKLLESTIPVSEIQGNTVINNITEIVDLEVMMKNVYNDYVVNGYTNSQIKFKMARLEPFDSYLEELMEFFEEMESIDE